MQKHRTRMRAVHPSPHNKNHQNKKVKVVYKYLWGDPIEGARGNDSNDSARPTPREPQKAPEHTAIYTSDKIFSNTIIN